MTDTTPVPKAPNDVPDDSGLANATGAIPTGASDGPGLASAPGAIPADGPAPDFASLLGGLDLGGLLQQAQAMQAQLAQAQTDLAGMRFSGTAGGGLVAATVSGQGELLSVDISPQAVDPEDAETLGDLVVAAVREATAKARRVAEASVPQVPGF